MEQDQQRRYYELGRSYWWLAGKYRIVDDALARAIGKGNGRSRRLLDLGCGPGNMLDYLARRGEVYGSDYSADALGFCRSRDYHRLFRADFQRLPVADASFDIVTCIDVLEHLDDDVRAIAELRRILRPGGTLLVTVPAFMSLWGDHDDLYGHRRRYRAGELRGRLAAAGFEVRKVSYFEPLFFLPLWLYRKAKRLLPVGEGLSARDDFVALPGFVNALLTELVASERFALRHASFPVGVTLLALAEAPPAEGASPS